MISGTRSFAWRRKFPTGMNCELSSRSSVQWMPINGSRTGDFTRTIVRPDAPRLIGSRVMETVGSTFRNWRTVERIASVGMAAAN